MSGEERHGYSLLGLQPVEVYNGCLKLSIYNASASEKPPPQRDQFPSLQAGCAGSSYHVMSEPPSVTRLA